MKRDITFYAVELDEYVTINVDVRVNVGIDRDIVNIEIPRSSSHYTDVGRAIDERIAEFIRRESDDE